MAANQASLIIRFLTDTTAAQKGMGGLVGGIGKMAKGVGAGLAALGIGKVITDSVKLEASFSKTMATLQASSGASGKEISKLRGLAMKLGADTAFSANEAAGAMLELSKAGVSTKDIMSGAAKGTLLLATAGGVDLATAATIASNAMNTFNLKGSQMDEVAAALAGGANASTASVESLGQALQQVGPGAVNAGLSLQETVGTLAAFDSAGIKGSDAGTSLKTMLARLVPSTKAARNAMEELGLKFTDSKGNFKSITNVAQQLHDKLGPLSQAQRQQALQTIFGSDASRAATVLMNKGAKGLAKYIKATKDQKAAQKMAKAAMSGTSGALERLSGAWETLQLAIGMLIKPLTLFAANMGSKVIDAILGVGPAIKRLASNPAIASLIDAFKNFAKAVGNAIGQIVPTIGKIVKALAPLAGAAILGAVTALTGAFKLLTPIVDVLGSVFGVLGDALSNPIFQTIAVTFGVAATAAFAPLIAQVVLANAQFAIFAARYYAVTAAQKVWTAATKAAAIAQRIFNASMLANPIGLIIVALIAAATAVVMLWKKNEGFRNFVMAAWTAIANAAKAAWNGIKAAISAVIGWAKGFISGFANVAKAIWRGIVGAARAAWNGIRAVIAVVINWAKAYLKAYAAVLKAIWKGISAAGKAAWRVIKVVIRAVVSWAKGYIKVWATVVKAVFKGMRAVAKTAWNGIKAAIRSVVGWAKGFLRGFGNVAKGVWRGISNVAKGAWGGIKGATGAAVGFMKARMSGFKSAVLGIWRAIKSVASQVWGAIGGVVRQFALGASRAFNKIKSAGTKVWRTIKSVASGALRGLLSPINAVKSAFDKVLGVVKDVIDWIKKIKLPNIGGAISKLNPFSAVAPAPPAASPRLMAAGPVGRSAFLSPTLSTMGRRSGTRAQATGNGNVIINVTGTLNDADTARAVRKVLRNDQRRRNGVVIDRTRQGLVN